MTHPTTCGRVLSAVALVGALTAGAIGPLPEASAAGTASITGRVTDMSNVAIAGVSVETYIIEAGSVSGVVTPVLTNEFGRYLVAGLEAGTYKLKFVDPAGRYESEAFLNVPDLTTARPIGITQAGQEVTNEVQDLAAATHVTGRVTFSAGVGPRTVRVSAFSEATGVQTAEVQTNADGYYDIAGLPPGSYRLEFVDTSGNYVRKLRTGVTVPTGTVPGPDVTLEPAAHVRGTVRREGGPAIEDVLVTAYADQGGVWQPAPGDLDVRTWPDGTYDVGGLPAGTYRIGFADPAYVAEFFDNQATLALARDIVVDPAAAPPVADAELAAQPVPPAPVPPVPAPVPPLPTPPVPTLPDPVPAKALVQNAALPKITGRPRVGRVVKVTRGAWTPGTVSLSYQWLANGKVIARATRAKLELTRRQAGKKLSVRVTATAVGYTSATITTRPTGKVRD